MAKLYLCGWAFLSLISFVAYSQDVPSSVTVVHPNQVVLVSGLPSLKARSSDGPDVLAASLETIFHDKDFCCERKSALEDRLPQSDPVSLKEVATKLQGRQHLSDGRPVMITADYFEPPSVNSGQLISAILAKHAPLMVWNSHLYVVQGVIFDQAIYNDGTITNVTRKFLLLDTRFTDSRREVSFNRDTDDPSKVQGILFLTVTPQ